MSMSEETGRTRPRRFTIVCTALIISSTGKTWPVPLRSWSTTSVAEAALYADELLCLHYNVYLQGGDGVPLLSFGLSFNHYAWSQHE